MAKVYSPSIGANWPCRFVKRGNMDGKWLVGSRAKDDLFYSVDLNDMYGGTRSDSCTCKGFSSARWSKRASCVHIDAARAKGLSVWRAPAPEPSYRPLAGSLY